MESEFDELDYLDTLDSDFEDESDVIGYYQDDYDEYRD